MLSSSRGTERRLLVHPVTDDEDYSLPCTCDYATGIRGAQGSSLVLGTEYFDCYPLERGYCYVFACRLINADRTYPFGCIRRMGWLLDPGL